MSVNTCLGGRGCRGASVGVQFCEKDFGTHLLWEFGGFEEAWTEWMQNRGCQWIERQTEVKQNEEIVARRCCLVS